MWVGGGRVGVERRATTLAGNFKLILSDSRGREASPSSEIRYSYRRTLATREQNYPSAWVVPHTPNSLAGRLASMYRNTPFATTAMIDPIELMYFHP
jgi:hypothetical protein